MIAQGYIIPHREKLSLGRADHLSASSLHSPVCVQAPGCEPRQTFLGRTEKEREDKITGRRKTAGQGGYVSDASRRSRLGMGTFSSVNISTRIWPETQSSALHWCIFCVSGSREERSQIHFCKRPRVFSWDSFPTPPARCPGSHLTAQHMQVQTEPVFKSQMSKGHSFLPSPNEKLLILELINWKVAETRE